MEDFYNRKSDEQELREFSRRLNRQESTTQRTLLGRRTRRRGGYIDIPEWLWLVSGILMLLAVVLLGIFICDIPIMAVIAVVFLETALGACLNEEPIWLHGGVIIMNIVLGIVFHVTIFMFLACLVYTTVAILIYRR